MTRLVEFGVFVVWKFGDVSEHANSEKVSFHFTKTVQIDTEVYSDGTRTNLLTMETDKLLSME